MVKKTVLLIAVLLGIYANAQETVKTSVADVTVFLKGAQVTRKTTIKFPAGISTFRFIELSPYIDAKSVQVKINGEVMIMSVNHTLNYNDTVKLDEEINSYVEHIKFIDNQLILEKTNIEIVDEEISFLKENKKISGADKGIEFNNLKLTAEYYNQQITALTNKKADINKKIRKLNEEQSVFYKKISTAGTTKPEPTGEVILTVNCKTAVQAPVELIYYVNNASWFPSYDIRAKDITAPIELVYKANVMQNTKEEWNKVNLRISSGNPKLGSVAPKLKTYLLNYWARAPRYDVDNNALSNTVSGIVFGDGFPLGGATIVIQGTSIGTATDADGRYSLTIPADDAKLVVTYVGYEAKTLPITSNNMNIHLDQEITDLEEETLYEPLQEFNFTTEADEVVVTGYGVRKKSTTDNIKIRGIAGPKAVPLPVSKAENTTSVEFDIKIPYTIASENKVTIVEMERYTLPADYEYYCVPKVDKDAFLLANIVNWEQYNLLEGEANIFFENTFVGKTILDTRYTADTLNISLGRDKNVVVKREKIKEFTQTKFLSSKAETTRNWKFTIRNNKQQPITMVLLDQIPVSTLSEIEVSEKVGSGILNKETGEVKWKFTIPSAQTTTFDLLYSVRYPKGNSLTVE